MAQPVQTSAAPRRLSHRQSPRLAGISAGPRRPPWGLHPRTSNPGPCGSTSGSSKSTKPLLIILRAFPCTGSKICQDCSRAAEQTILRHCIGVLNEEKVTCEICGSKAVSCDDGLLFFPNQGEGGVLRRKL